MGEKAFGVPCDTNREGPRDLDWKTTWCIATLRAGYDGLFRANNIRYVLFSFLIFNCPLSLTQQFTRGIPWRTQMPDREIMLVKSTVAP